MGGLCSKRSAVDKSPSESTLDSNGLRDQPMPNQSRSKMKGALAYSIAGDTMEERLQEQTFSVTEGMSVPAGDLHAASAEATEPQLSRAFSHKSRSTMSKPSDPEKKEELKELYHELHALDKFEQDYKRKHQEDNSANGVQRGDNLQIPRQDLKSQRKHVKSLKKRSLWSKNLEEVSRSNSVPSNTRDSLYQGLPPTMKNAFRCRLQSFQIKEEIPVPQIKAEMEKSLRWLVPIANNTTKSEVNRKPGGSVDLIRVETLYHADKEKTEAYILNLLLWLHHHISRSKSSGGGIKSPVCSPTREGLTITSLSAKPSPPSSVLSQEDEEMLQYVNFRKLIPGISKSQEFDTTKSKSGRHNRLSKSNSHSPASCTRKDFFAGARRPSMLPVIDFNIDRVKALDVIDRVDDIRKP
ncbi:hypothetical protein MUK42_26696 [Musa troglodytarum]|uniref:DUF668 domain-containing protein n=1 Tax=Musa troglodytarum TaxID=320322 RepID=A0A9E7F026_9LILI|nr:hypothetical protein MUK42_26696 [Musa troglodytarum]